MQLFYDFKGLIKNLKAIIMKFLYFILLSIFLLKSNVIYSQFGTQQIIYSNFHESISITAADLDNDGDKDVIASSGIISYFKNDSIGNFGTELIISNDTSSNRTVFAVDIDNDADIDIISTSTFKVSFFRNDGLGNFGNEEIIDDTTAFNYSVYATDMNNDGNIDILVGSSSEISLYTNDGVGNFTPKTITTNVDLVTSIYAVDIDNDMDMDIIASSSQDDKISYYINDGTGNFGSQQIVSDNSYFVQSVRASDIDGDGYMDIISACSNGNSVSWYKNDGLGEFSNEHYISNVQSASTIFAADIDSDGDMDIISASILSDNIVWFQNDGFGNFGQELLIANSLNAHKIYVVDIDNDGDPDVLSTSYNASYSPNVISLYENCFGAKHKITGNIFCDFNQNGQKDSLDNNLVYIQTELQPNEIASYSNTEGEYWFAVDTGNYVVTYNSSYNLSNWYLTTDSTEYNINIENTDSIIQNINFGFYPSTYITNINPELVMANIRCDMENTLWINFQNIGTTTPSGNIELILDDSITYVSASLTPDSIINNTIFWSFDTLNYFETNQINLTVLMPNFNSIGDTLKNIVSIYSIDSTGQHFFSDTLSEEFECSYDPNDKIVTPKGEGINGIISNEEILEYVIRFQNTGNAEAINIKIRDQISENINIQSIQILASSHEVNSYIEQNRWLVFQFDSIMLPDSSNNYLESQGFVKYRVKVKDTALPNAKILNTANIYFDYNPAVITNTVLNTVECYITPIAPNIEILGVNLFVNTPYEVQWYLNDTIISGATDSIYYPTVSGNYSAEIFDENGCSSFTDIFIITGISKSKNLNMINISPNPTTGIITVIANKILQISVFNINGEKILDTSNNTFNLETKSKGLYFVKVTTQSGVYTKKIILK